MSRELTPEEVRAFVAHMTSHFEATLVDKGDAKEMKLVGELLDKLGILDKDEFLENYATTIRSKLYLPFTPGVEEGNWTLWNQLVTVAHECQHVVQHRRDGLAYEVGYVTDTSARARHEAEAYLTNLELRYWREGAIPTPRRFAEKLASYGCTEQDILWAAKYMTLVAETVKLGGVVTEAGAVALDWLDENAPDLAHDAV
jgi:hypothetical protein